MQHSHCERVTSTGRNRCPCRFASVNSDAGEIEAHRLIVQNANGAGRETMRLQVSTRVRDQREAGGVRLGKTVEREGGDGLNDPFLCRLIILFCVIPRRSLISTSCIRFSDRLNPTARPTSMTVGALTKNPPPVEVTAIAA